MFEECLYFNATALARHLEKEWTKAFADMALTPAQAFMLRVVLGNPGAPQREVAATLAISRPTATRALDGLVAKGLVERRGSERDGREQTVHPTAAAISMHLALNAASGKVTKRLKRLLGDETFAEAVLTVRAVRSALE